ncbi:MAG: ShlB/FhaC/HecB family hemolysin secretion/activation protein [Oceanococcus sp.]
MRELERIQQAEQQRRERERQERLSRQPRTIIEAPAPELPKSGEGGPCRDISEVQFDGATKLDERGEFEFTEEFAGRCLAVSDIEKLLGAVTAWYVNRGFISARAYIQTQDLAKGILRVLILEGKVESLTLDDEDDGSINLSTAFPGVTGELLNLRDFEQGLDQINRLSSNRATMELLPGEKPGASVVLIRNQRQRRVHGNFTLDNYGSDSTGANQSGLSLLLDNGLRINDSASLTYRRSLSSDLQKRYSETTSGLYSVPFGYFLLTASQVFTEYVTPVELPNSSLSAEGRSSISSLQLDYVAFRDRINRVQLYATLNSKDSKNFLGGTRLDVSSRRLSSVELAGSWSGRFWGGTLNNRLAANQGVDWFGGQEDPAGLPSDAPTAKHLKWLWSGSWNRPFAVKGQPLIYAASLSGQWSDDVLFGTEQTLIGSVFSVRGYRNNSFSGDRGLYWRNDLSFPLGLQLLRRPVSLRPYLAIDAGKIFKHFGIGEGSLVGASTGVSFSGFGLNLDVQVVTPLRQPSEFQDEGVQWYANFSYRI